MNPPNTPPLPPDPRKPTPQPPAAASDIKPPPLPSDAGFGLLVDSLLKRPAQLVRTLCVTKSSRPWLLFLLVTLFAFAFYGLVIGSFFGGAQYGVSPLKTATGELLCILICFPSFYIFSCLSGIDVSMRGLAGVFLSVCALTGLLLIGFAPVAWVFSQSTESVNFIGVLHMVFWAISTLFGLRLLGFVSESNHLPERIHMKVWAVIFLMVSLQMTTALRPLISPSAEWLPKEKKFFLTYWVDNFTPDTKADPGLQR